MHGRLAREELERSLDRRVEHVGDAHAAAANSEHALLEALAAARRADEPHVGEKLHLDRFVALAGAALAAAALDVEREGRRSERMRDGFGLPREERANGVPGLRVRRGVAARRAAERRLIDERHALHGVRAVDGVVCARQFDVEVAEAARERAVEDVDHERALSRAARSRDGAEHTEREPHVSAPEVVLARATDGEKALGCATVASHVARRVRALAPSPSARPRISPAARRP